MKLTREEDQEIIRKLSKQKILDLFFLQVRNIWRVDGLYFMESRTNSEHRPPHG